MTIENKDKNKKIVIKKRFFVICILIAVIVIFLLAMGVKGVIGIISGDGKTAKEASAKLETDVSSTDSENGNTEDSQSNIEQNSVSENETAFAGSPTEDSTEYKINKAVLASWFISPLGQKRSVVDEKFGSIVRSEEWGRKIYYHRSFVDTMYVTYEGYSSGDDDNPDKNAVCDSVSIALNNVLEFDKFTPNKSFWGEIHEEKGNYAEGQYYLVLIRDDIKMKVYCDQQGRVSGESHIVVSKC